MKLKLVKLAVIMGILSFFGLSVSNAIPKPGTNSVRSVTAREFKAEIEKNSADSILLDIRTPKEYSDGHIKGALNIDFYARDFRSNLDALDRTKKYLIYCRSGNRSGQALTMMKSMKFRNIIHLKNGILDWQKNNLPLEK